MSLKNGNLFVNIITGGLVVAIVILGYLLWQKRTYTDVNAHGTDTPQVQSAQTTQHFFTDGLGQPNSQTHDAPDETGSGITKTEVFNRDINNDGRIDRIRRIRHETGTSHFWDEYVIELLRENGTWHNITPPGFRTTNGAECALQKIQFVFQPKFHAVKISRPWAESWDTPTMATKTIYQLKNNQMATQETKQVGVVCDVTSLFIEK